MSRHRPHVLGFAAHGGGDWRTIGGVDFQQLKAYVLVGAPDPERPDLLVWLVKSDDVWKAKLCHGTRALGSRSRPHAQGAVEAILRCAAWASPPERVTDHGPVPDFDPYPANYAHAPAGWYAERPTAHDGRWDSPTGVL